MECHDARALLHASADDELGATDALGLEQHLAACPACRAELNALRTLRARVREGAPYYRADAALRASLLAALPELAMPAPTIAPAPAEAPPRAHGARSTKSGGRQPRWLRWFAWPPAANAAMAALTVATLSFGLLRYAQVGAPADSLANALVDSHVRALLSGRTYDVASSDRHTVKPWFNGRLDYAPPVYDLAAHGFPLVGARLDHVAGRTVAVLVYRRNQHPIDVFVLPEDTARLGSARPLLREGYVLESWSAGEMRLWAVSDTGIPELRGLREAWQQAYQADRAAAREATEAE